MLMQQQQQTFAAASTEPDQADSSKAAANAPVRQPDYAQKRSGGTRAQHDAQRDSLKQVAYQEQTASADRKYER